MKDAPRTAALSLSSSNETEEHPLRYIKGVGPAIAELLAQKGIESLRDLLDFFPFKYLDRRSLTPIKSLTPGPDRVTAGRILTCGIAFGGRTRRKIFEILLGDDSGAISLKWFRFNPRQMMGGFKKRMGLLVSGEVTEFRGVSQFIHPTVQVMDADVIDEIAAPGIVPVYSQINGLGQKILKKMIGNALELFEKSPQEFQDPLPDSLRELLHLLNKMDSYREIHSPNLEEDLNKLANFRTPAFLREIFEEFFLMELGLAVKRKSAKKEAGIPLPVSETRAAEWKQSLPFRLTGAQERVFSEITDDLKGPYPMNRLLQGDVGSGKTAVCFLSALAAIENGYQVALMAPTEILAEQHFQNARTFFAPHKVPVSLLTGRMTPAEKKKGGRYLERGMVPFVVGTHALLSEGVKFKNLGLVIIDEQHRFGVLQRASLKEKGANPHILVMTATPIPRTLAMTIYGDLDLSVIDEMPPGRLPIQTELLPEKSRRLLYGRIGEILARGEQGYIVYPLVEESEKLALRDATQMYQELQSVFPKFTVALLHGRVSSDEKESVMRAFKSGEVQLLVSTTVIEVGIDVPNATLMVIEHADRFGLSQLHQLRGRVGRGAGASTCLLVGSGPPDGLGMKRLRILCESQDGFRIAEEDLKIRGPGEFLGTRQSGLPSLRIAHLLRDYKILERARKEAFLWIDQDPNLTQYPPLKKALFDRWGEKLALADVG